MKTRVINFLGWFGVILIVGAYFVVTFGFLDPRSVIYLIFHLIGSLFIIIETYAKRDFQPAFLNVIWALIALVGLVQVLLF